MAENRRAIELDPLFSENSSTLGWDLYFARRYDQAVTELRKCIDLQPGYRACHFYLGLTYQQQGRFPARTNSNMNPTKRRMTVAITAAAISNGGTNRKKAPIELQQT